MNYKESTITGELTTWRRSRAVGINNPYNQVPTINFYEEDVTSLPNGKLIYDQINNTLKTDLADPEAEFELVNPLDNTVIGTAKYKEVYILLYSLYMKLAQERDLAETIVVDPVI